MADLGCGIGNLLPFLAGRFRKVVAIDFSSGMLRQARARNAKVISVSSTALMHKSNIQDFGHYVDIDLDIGADAEATERYVLSHGKRRAGGGF